MGVLRLFGRRETACDCPRLTFQRGSATAPVSVPAQVPYYYALHAASLFLWSLGVRAGVFVRCETFPVEEGAWLLQRVRKTTLPILWDRTGFFDVPRRDSGEPPESLSTQSVLLSQALFREKEKSRRDAESFAVREKKFEKFFIYFFPS